MIEPQSRTGDIEAAPRWLGPAATINLALGIGYAAIFTFYAIRAHFSVPYVDDWSWLASLQVNPFTKGLWLPHNEHIIVIPRLLVWLDFWIWGWPGYATLIAALLSHLTIAGVLIAACRERGRVERRLVSGGVLFLTFLTYELQGAVFPSSVLFPLVAAFAILAVWSLAKCAGKADSRSVSRSANLSLVWSVMAMLCLTNGLIVPFVLAGLSLLLRLPRRHAVAFLVVGFAGLFARYAIGRIPSTILMASPAAQIRFGLAMLAGPIATLSPRLAVAVGGCFGLLSVAVLWRFARDRDRKPSAVLVAGNIGFVLASVAMAAAGRANFDLSVAAESRYTELVAMGWASLLLEVVPTAMLYVWSAKSLAVLMPALALAMLPLQIFVGRVWAAKADHLGVASLVLTVGVDDRDWLWRIHPWGRAYIDPALPQLRERGVKFLSFPELGTIVAASGSNSAACEGDIEAIDPGPVSSGLRVQGHLRERAPTLRIVDSERRVQGLAKPAPVVRHGRANANDFVWAEIDVLRGRLSTEGDWLGFTAKGSGPPYIAQLVEESGRLVCEIPVACCRAPSREDARPELVIRGSSVEGFLDVATCAVVAGWAWDPIRPHQNVDVRIRSAHVDVKATASMFRSDLIDRNIGDGRYGFSVSAPDWNPGTGEWRVDALVADTGVPLTGSPRTITCP